MYYFLPCSFINIIIIVINPRGSEADLEYPNSDVLAVAAGLSRDPLISNQAWNCDDVALEVLMNQKFQ